VGVFERIVCGVDGSPESREAVRQADGVLEPGGRLVLVAVVDLTQAIHFRIAPTALHAARHALEDVDELDRATLEALEIARAQVARAEDVATSQVGGSPASALLEAAAEEHASLVAVGTHGLGRATGVLLGSVATRVLHRASSSVLVARPPGSGGWPPRTIVVGLDGSAEAEAALLACRELESRFGSGIREVTIAHRRPAHALGEAAREADLLAVGASGTGRRSFGSVAEHVAHDASCSVLVVRRASGPSSE
jgi:nucleotide-binding universal stress UspA family protein